MHFIEHIIEPDKLLLAWQSSNEAQRTRYIVAELNRHSNKEVSLTYLINTEDFQNAEREGFESYPAFQDVHKTHHNLLDAFMRRLPPRTRGDFSSYMESLRLKPDTNLSDFALLGYSGGKLLSDGFSIIHPFNNVHNACELLMEMEAAGYRHIHKNNFDIKVNDPVFFEKENYNDVTKKEAIRIIVNKTHIGYVNKGLLPTVFSWIDSNRVIDAWVEKINGTSQKPALYVYVQIKEKLKPMTISP